LVPRLPLKWGINPYTGVDDGLARPEAPPTRYVSNRIFNDVGQNLFSENGVTQWGWAWGQFMDHDFGLRDETPAESAPISFGATDALEAFANDLGAWTSPARLPHREPA